MEMKQYMTSGKSLITIDLSNLNAGLYFVRIAGKEINKIVEIIHNSTQ